MVVQTAVTEISSQAAGAAVSVIIGKKDVV